MKKITILNVILFLISIMLLAYNQTHPKEIVLEKTIKVPEIQTVEKTKEVQTIVYKTKFVNQCSPALTESSQVVSQDEKLELSKSKKESTQAHFDQKKNRLTLFGAHGPKDLDYSQDGINYNVEMKRDLLAGIMYSRVIKGELSLSAGAITNETYMLGVGWDF